MARLKLSEEERRRRVRERNKKTNAKRSYAEIYKRRKEKEKRIMDALLTEEDKASRVRLSSRSKKIQNAKAYRKRATTSLKAKPKSAQKSAKSANRRVSSAIQDKRRRSA